MIEVTQTNKIVNLTVEEVTKTANIEIVQEGIGGAVNSVNGKDGTVTLNQDEIPDGTTYKRYSLTEKNKLASITEIFTTALKTAYDGVVSGYTALMQTGSRLITSGEITKLSNTSGNNTGDQDLTGYATEEFVLENMPEVDTSLLAVQDGTVLYHISPAVNTGTVSSIGTNWTTAGFSMLNKYLGAKLTVAGQTTIINSVNQDAATFTTVDVIPVTNASFQIKCISVKIFQDGAFSIYEKNGDPLFFSDPDGYIVLGSSTSIDTSGRMAINSGRLKVNMPTYADDAAAASDGGLESNSFYRTTGSTTVKVKP